MKISLKWLNEYVDVADFFSKPEELGEKLTRAGLEVEEMQNLSLQFKNVVIGHILEKGQHPNADKLSLCRVSTGDGDVHQIVCGAQNHKTGDRVIVALPGAVLPGNFQIKKSAIRGVESLGMLCSYKELGLADTSDGIAILETDAPVGKSFAEFSGRDDVTFELKVTPNRADCLSHYGLAREVSCLLGRPLKNISTEFKSSDFSTLSSFKLDVLDKTLCPRYTGRQLKGVKVGVSPEWLKQKLESVEMSSINNVVDITNFVMMELGQPLHAFDAHEINEQHLIINKVPAGEKFQILDGTEKVLKGEELGIRDGQKTLCLAGVMGGKNSGVTEKTTEIFLESAYFLSSSVRRTSRNHGIESDSAYRFSRGVDPEGAKRALDRATSLILQVAGGVASQDAYDVYPEPVIKKPIEISIQYVSERLGYVAQENLFLQMMKSLGCEVNVVSTGNYSVLPPSFRFDLEQDMDLVEEYARLHGYEHIPETLPELKTPPSFHDKFYSLMQKISEWSIQQGYNQAFNFAFVGSKEQNLFLGQRESLRKAGLPLSEEDIQILNPLNEDLNVMRSTLSYGLVQNMIRNFHSGNEVGQLFETGSAFSKSSAEGESAFIEGKRWALIHWGHRAQLWEKKSPAPLVFEIKSAIESVLKKLNISAYTWVKTNQLDEVPSFCHPGQYAQLVVEGKKLGFIATLHPSISEDKKIRVPVAIAEFDLESLLKGQPRPLKTQSLSKFPMVERDFSFVAEAQTPVGDILKDVKKAAGPLCIGAEVFDIFQDEKIGQGKKSISMRIWLQDKNATLQEAQLQECHSRVIQVLQKNFNIMLR